MKIILFLALMFFITSCSENSSETVVKTIENKYPGIQSYKIILDGKEKISHALPPDIPLIGAMGRDSYHFTGKILFDGKSFDFETKQYFPLCAIKFNEKYYLVLCYYFVQTKYAVYELNNDSWIKKELWELPEAVSYANLPDKYYSKSFKMRYIDSILDQKGIDYAISMLNSHLAEDPRAFFVGDIVAFNEARKSHKVKMVTTKTENVVHLLKKIQDAVITEEQSKLLYDLAIKIFHSITPNDRTHEIVNLIGFIEEKHKDFLVEVKKHINDEFIRKIPDKSEQEHYRYWLNK